MKAFVVQMRSKNDGRLNFKFLIFKDPFNQISQKKVIQIQFFFSFNIYI